MFVNVDWLVPCFPVQLLVRASAYWKATNNGDIPQVFGMNAAISRQDVKMITRKCFSLFTFGSSVAACVHFSLIGVVQTCSSSRAPLCHVGCFQDLHQFITTIFTRV